MHSQVTSTTFLGGKSITGFLRKVDERMRSWGKLRCSDGMMGRINTREHHLSSSPDRTLCSGPRTSEATTDDCMPPDGKKASRVTTLIQRRSYNTPNDGLLFGGKERPGGLRQNNVLLHYGEVVERAISARYSSLQFQIFKQLVHQYCGPKNRFEKSPYSHPESRSLLQKIYQRADECHTIDSARDTAFSHRWALATRSVFFRHGWIQTDGWTEPRKVIASLRCPVYLI